MKNKGVKIALIASGSALVLGGILLGAGVSLGGSPSFYLDEQGLHVKENTQIVPKENYAMEATKTGAVRKLTLNLVDADVQIVSGDEWSVEYELDGQRLEPVYRFEDGELTLEEGEYDYSGQSAASFEIGGRWWQNVSSGSCDPHVKITVPDGGSLEEVSIDTRYGDVEIERNLRAKTARIDAKDGSVRMDGWNGDELELNLEYGSLTAGELNGANVTVDNENGAIRIGALKVDTADLRMEYGELTADVERAKSLDVENENGNVTLYLVGGVDSFGVNLHTDYGMIRTPEGTVRSDDYDGSSDYIRAEGDAAAVRVYTDYGDIRIREK